MPDDDIVESGSGQFRIFRLQESGRGETRKVPHLSRQQPELTGDEDQTACHEWGPDEGVRRIV
jgi:hypothetical protein